MEALDKLLSGRIPLVVSVLALAVLVLLAWTLVLAGQLARLKRRWGQIFEGSDASSIEAKLDQVLSSHKQVTSGLAINNERVETLESKAKAAKRFVGLVRFDAFEDVGGEQSFALAIYDEEGDGVVVSSLIGRTDCRVYCKAIHAGRAERDLSREERLAIEEAAFGRSKAAKR